MVPGLPPACIASMARTRSAHSKRCSASRTAVPTSTARTPRGTPCWSARTACTPTPSSFKSRLPRPATRMRGRCRASGVLCTNACPVMLLPGELYPTIVLAEMEDLRALCRPHDVDGAGEARIKGVDDAQDLDGLVDVEHGG